MMNLIEFTRTVDYKRLLLESMLEGTIPLTDAERLQQTASFRIKSINPYVEVTKQQDFPNIDDIHLQVNKIK